MDIKQIDLEDLKTKLSATLDVQKDEVKLPEKRLPKTVRKLRAARIKRKIYRQTVIKKARAGDNHYKRKRKKRNETRWKYEREGQLRYKEKLYSNPATRYFEIKRRCWKKRLTEQQLSEVMSQEEYIKLMEYVPERLYEMRSGVIVDSRHRNLDKYSIDELLVNSYPNQKQSAINSFFHKIVRLDITKSYTMDNILVIDLYSNLVLYKPNIVIYKYI